MVSAHADGIDVHRLGHRWLLTTTGAGCTLVFVSKTRIAMAAFVALLAIASLAGAEAIQKWRTPQGALYFGDRPAAGSTLLQTIADTPRADAPGTPAVPSGLEQAAAEGRDIIRRREADRAAQRQLDAERSARLDALAADQAAADASFPFLFIDTFHSCVPGERCFHRHLRHHEGRGSWGSSPRHPAVQRSAVAQTPAGPLPRSRGGFLFGSAWRGRLVAD